MIKRNYFAACDIECSGEKAHFYGHLTYTSWIDSSQEALLDFIEKAKEESLSQGMIDPKIHVTAFNRV